MSEKLTTKTFGQKVTRDLLREMFGESCTREQLLQFEKRYGWFPQFIASDPAYRLSRGAYKIPAAGDPLSEFGPAGAQREWCGEGMPVKFTPEIEPDEVDAVIEAIDAESPAVMADVIPLSKHKTDTSARALHARLESIREEASLFVKVPRKLPEYVPYGEYEFVKGVVKSRAFLPIYVTGLSGNGKTLDVKQACAETDREYIRCNITIETDEDDLIGGFRLRDGDTVFEPGPVLVAMLRGAVLFVDEIDKASAKIMALQAVLEGEPLVVKKLGIIVDPAPGFTIIASANTKGGGDETGKFVTSTLLDEAFLERFPVTIEKDYPPPDIENQILTKTFEQMGGTLTGSTKAFFLTLTNWAENIRKAYKENASDGAVMTTRRLCHIVRTFKTLGPSDKRNQAKALALCLNRFDEKTKGAFVDLYNKHVNDDGTPTNVGTVKPPSKF